MKNKILQLSTITSLALVSLNASTIEPIINWTKYPIPQEVVSKSKGGQLSDKVAMKDGVGAIIIKSINGNSITLNNEQYNQLLLLNKDKLTDTIGLKELITSGDIVVDASTLNAINGNSLSNPNQVPLVHVNGTSCTTGIETIINQTWLNDICQGGESIVGKPCDDTNANTENDVYDTNGICVGTPLVLSCANSKFETTYPGDATKNTGKNGFVPTLVYNYITTGRINFNGLFNNISINQWIGNSTSYWDHNYQEYFIASFDKPFRIWRTGSSTWNYDIQKLAIYKMATNNTTVISDLSSKHLNITNIDHTSWEVFTECIEPGNYKFILGSPAVANGRIDNEWFVESAVVK